MPSYVVHFDDTLGVVPPPTTVSEAAVRAALAVHYFPGMWSWNRAVVAPLVDAALARAGGTAELQALLDAYRDWARAADRFIPLRVDCELEVQVPHPADLDRGLLTAEGLPVRYRDRVPLALVDDRERHWLGEFHLVDRFGDPDRFHPDERSLLRCWAWEQTELSGRLIGTQVTELQLSPFDFRRTEIPRPHRDRTAAARKLAEGIADRLFR